MCTGETFFKIFKVMQILRIARPIRNNNSDLCNLTKRNILYEWMFIENISNAPICKSLQIINHEKTRIRFEKLCPQ